MAKTALKKAASGRFSRKISDFGRCTAAEVGRVFGVSRQAVCAWKGCPRNSDGSYSLTDVIQWKLDGLTAQLKERAPEPESSALERYREARARRAELEVGQLQDSLVDKADVEARWGRVLSYIVQAFDGIGKVLAPRLAQRQEREIAQTIRDEVHHTIESARAMMLADEEL